MCGRLGLVLAAWFDFAGRIASELILSQVISVLAFQSAVMPPMAKTMLSGERP